MLIFNKRNLVAVASLVVALAVLVLGVWLGGHPSTLPAFARSTFEANHPTEVFNEAIDSLRKTTTGRSREVLLMVAGWHDLRACTTRTRSI